MLVYYGARDNADYSFFEALKYTVMNEIACLLKSYIRRFSLTSDLLITRLSSP
jgi:hypothetical protein